MIGIGSGDDNASEMHLSKETLLPYLSIKFYGKRFFHHLHHSLLIRRI